jgi:DNA-binding transcriptional MerR regulator
MPKKSPLHYKYNPALSIKENAERCGVSVAAIRKFIQENNIDRKRDTAIHKQRVIQ